MMAMEGCMLVDTLYSFSGSQTEGPFVVCHDGQSLEHSLPPSHPFFPLPNLHLGGVFVPGLIDKHAEAPSDDLNIECSDLRHTPASFLTVPGALELKSCLHQHIDVLLFILQGPTESHISLFYR